LWKTHKGFRGALPQAAVLALLCASLTTFSSTASAQQGVFVITGSLNNYRDNHTATLLNSGKVLIAGGMGQGGSSQNNFSIASAELYDPAAGIFTLTGSMNDVRQNHTATLLNNGIVLIAGGQGAGGVVLASAELYDPTSGTFTLTGSLNTARQHHTATLLNNGKVLIVGGQADAGNSLATAELYDPATGTFTPTGSLNTARTYSTAALVNNGKVLIAGGDDVTSSGGSALGSAELYDPATGVFTATGNLNTARSVHTATLLNNGMVLVTGGGGTGTNGTVILASAELYASPTGTFTSTGSLNNGRANHTATLLNNGTVLVAGGFGAGFLTSAELYEPTTGTFTVTGSLNQARDSHTATLLNNQTVLIAGGFLYPSEIASAELYEQVLISPTSLAFAAQPTGTTSPPQTVTLTNNESTALSITSISISGTNASDFAETDNCVGSVAPGTRCNINVTFTPAATGTPTASLNIITNPAIPLTVALTGTATPPAPIVSLSALNVAFASQAVGTPSAPQTVTLRNVGSSTLNIQAVSISGADAGDFSVATGTTCTNGATVAPSNSCLIQLIFTPTASVTRTATVSITDNAADSPETIGLSGSLPVPLISPSKISFPVQYVGTSGLPQSVTVTNNGNSPLNIAGVAASPSDFGTLNACGSALAAGASCAIGVFFDPTAGGSRTGTLTISDNGSASPQTVALDGTGQDFSLAPASSASSTISSGQTANFSVGVLPSGGFNQSVALTCSGAPAQSTCALSPNSVTLNGSAATMVTVTVMTTAASLPPAPSIRGDYRPLFLITALLALLVLLLLTGLLGWSMGRPRLAYGLAVLFVLCAAVGMAACGGGSSGMPSGGTINRQTPAGTYTVVVSGSFTSGSTRLTHNANLTLVVQ
jgi:hypothetical protein